MNNPVQIGDFRCGTGEKLFLIAGPCVIENEAITLSIAEKLVEFCQRLNIGLLFKASFDKANRSSGVSFRGLGIQEGLRVLEKVKNSYGIEVTTDIHEPSQAEAASQVCAVLQIPAFLARQTDLLVAAARTGKCVNVKKGQFMAPGEMKNVVKKLVENGTENVLLCERGTFFGYGNLVNDMRSIPEMQSMNVPVVFDATHSVQKPAGLGDATGGNREMVEPLAKAAVAAGADAVFLETHPDPDQSPSDGPNMVPLDRLEALLAKLSKLRDLVISW